MSENYVRTSTIGTYSASTQTQTQILKLYCQKKGTMVKKKGKSKRTTLKDKYKIQKRIVQTHRKRRKEAKKNAAAGIIKHKPKVRFLL